VADLEPEAVRPHRQRIGGVEDDLAAHVAQGADRGFGAVPRRRQHDDVGRRRRFRSRAGPRLAAERAHKCLHLFGLRIAHAEENLVPGLLRPGGAEGPADTAGTDDGEIHW